jgi:hypothetical protein
MGYVVVVVVILEGYAGPALAQDQGAEVFG